MILFCGLGNPDLKYKNTRHNIGFLFLDYFTNEEFTFNKKFHADILIKNEFIFCKPQVYMNNSGISISKIVNFYKIDTENIFVFYDDLDLNFGKIKMKIGGNSGGHNGIKSIDSFIKNEYIKIKIGIKNLDYNENAADFVLSDFNKSEMEKLNDIFLYIKEKIDIIFSKNIQSFNATLFK